MYLPSCTYSTTRVIAPVVLLVLAVVLVLSIGGICKYMSCSIWDLSQHFGVGRHSNQTVMGTLKLGRTSYVTCQSVCYSTSHNYSLCSRRFSYHMQTGRTSVLSALTTKILPASITIPVLSSTPFANISASYSIYSAFVGVPAAATAILTLLVPVLLLHSDKSPLKMCLGTVYTLVFVAAVNQLLLVFLLPFYNFLSVILKSSYTLGQDLLHRL